MSTCETCKYFFYKATGGNQVRDFGECRYDPHFEKRRPLDWCGKFEAMNSPLTKEEYKAFVSPPEMVTVKTVSNEVVASKNPQPVAGKKKSSKDGPSKKPR